jgi:hypothetical protein
MWQQDGSDVGDKLGLMRFLRSFSERSSLHTRFVAERLIPFNEGKTSMYSFFPN